jgi:hypothetical protein
MNCRDVAVVDRHWDTIPAVGAGNTRALIFFRSQILF